MQKTKRVEPSHTLTQLWGRASQAYRYAHGAESYREQVEWARLFRRRLVELAKKLPFPVSRQGGRRTWLPDQPTLRRELEDQMRKHPNWNWDGAQQSLAEKYGVTKRTIQKHSGPKNHRRNQARRAASAKVRLE